MSHTRTLLEKNFRTPLQPWKSSQVKSNKQIPRNSGAVIQVRSCFFGRFQHVEKFLHAQYFLFARGLRTVNTAKCCRASMIQSWIGRVSKFKKYKRKFQCFGWKHTVFGNFFLPQSQTLKSIRPWISRSQTTTKNFWNFRIFHSTCLIISNSSSAWFSAMLWTWGTAVTQFGVFRLAWRSGAL